MRTNSTRCALWACLAPLVWTSCASLPDADRSPISAKAAFVDSVLETLSLADKAGEMTQLTLDMVCVGKPYHIEEPHRIDTAKLQRAIVDLRVGSILNCAGHAYTPAQWHDFIGTIQTAAATKESGLPVLYGIDAIHGATYTSGAVLGPQQIGLAATWDTALVRKMAENTAKEVHATGIPWNFSPVLDVGRDARWPRLWETFGEAPKLVSDMGVAMVKGYQEGPSPIAATLKHYVGYSRPLSGQDRTPAWIPERQLRQYFLPPFAAAIDAGASSVMVNSGEMNGIPVHSDPFVLKDILRDELGFDGLVVSDWEDIRYLFTRHKVAADYKDAIVMAIDAGIDMSMVPTDYQFPELLVELVEEGRISESRLDESVRRILSMKYDCGLFQSGGMPPALAEYPDKAGLEGTAARAALESITVLKNEGQHAVYPDQPILPIGGTGTLLVTGPTAHSLNALNGGWTGTWQGDDPTFNTPDRPTAVEAMRTVFGAERIDFQNVHMNFDADDIDRIAQHAARTKPQCAVVFLGEMPYTESPGNIEDLELFDNQQDLVAALTAQGVPVVGVFIGGRPRTMANTDAALDALVMAYLPGDYGARAIADVLSGHFNPSGRLPITWPRYASSHITHDRKYTENDSLKSEDHPYQPLYPFGHGLSYSEVVTTDVNILNGDAVVLGDTLDVEVTLYNTGTRSTTETVILFSQDHVASITPAVDELKAYKQEVVPAGATKKVRLRVDSKALGFIGRDMKYTVEPGQFGFRVKDRTAAFTLQAA
jgi:beta-glucosidase